MDLYISTIFLISAAKSEPEETSAVLAVETTPAGVPKQSKISDYFRTGAKTAEPSTPAHQEPGTALLHSCNEAWAVDYICILL